METNLTLCMDYTSTKKKKRERNEIAEKKKETMRPKEKVKDIKPQSLGLGPKSLLQVLQVT